MDSPSSPSATTSWRAHVASHILVLTLLLLVLVYGMLAGLLAICIGFMLASALAGRALGHAAPPEQPSRGGNLSPGMAAGVVIVLPILGVLALMLNARGMAFGAIAQYQQLLHHLANTVLQIREKLPPDLAGYLPIGITEAQAWLVEYLQSQARSLTHLGSVGLRGGLLVYVGLIVGALMVGTPRPVSQGPLRDALRQRGADFMLSFKQIVVAQFWIAAFNAACTALFLLVALPLADVSIPYTGALIMLTFVAGLIPIVGNLLCNGVLTLAGVSVAPMVGVACLLFLIAIHKFEYFINAKIVGKRTSTSAWELLTVMFIGEAVFGLSGLVAAPLLYAYTKRELRSSGLI
jgi:predicted PurR-regulated permease PerM